MSKIGKKPIALPSGVTVEISGRTLTVKGPKGTLTRGMPEGAVLTVAENTLTVAPADHDRAAWGLARALAASMVTGVSSGWSRVLEFQGVGYKAVVKGSDLELSLGYSHPITVSAPEGITFATDKTSITVSGIDRELVGHAAAHIRSLRLPEPYKGSGIRYSDEVIKRKVGKRAATGTA